MTQPFQRICILGSTFAPKTFRKAWAEHFTIVQKPEEAQLVLVSRDTAIDKDGNREQESLRELVKDVYSRIEVPLILTSQVTPGFTRSLKLPIYHLAETLRIKDAHKRALNPDYFAIGCEDPKAPLPMEINNLFFPFNAEVIRCSYEEAEFSKIAVNMTLASQVDNANRLSKAAEAVGADWEKIAYILGKDKRIGPESYHKPGRWQDSQHLLRDAVTLKEIENG